MDTINKQPMANTGVSAGKKLLLNLTACEAIKQKVRVVPITPGGKYPCIKAWQDTPAGVGQASCDPKQLCDWQRQFKNKLWGEVLGRHAGVGILDIDCKKENGRVVGPPVLPPGVTKLLEGLVKQPTASSFKGVTAFHIRFKWQERFNIFHGSYFKGTTIEWLGTGKQRVLYKADYIACPPIAMPEELFNVLKKLAGIRAKRVQSLVGEPVNGLDHGYTQGNRNNTLNKNIYKHTIRGDFASILEEYHQGRVSKMTVEEAKKTALSAIRGAGGLPTPDPASNPSQTLLTAELYKKIKITDISWFVKNWFEYGLSLIAGSPCSGKSTLAIKLAVANALKQPIYTPDGPRGDGRPSLYICFERKKERGFNKEVACGGNGKQVDIFSGFKDEQGQFVPPNLEDDAHLNTILKLIEAKNYAMVIIDPIADLVLSKQNDNALIREAITKILNKTEGMQTALIGIAHLRKQKTGTDDLGLVRGASELVNIATSVCKTFPLLDDSGHVLCKLKVNESVVGNKGGIKYKIDSRPIPPHLLDPKAKEKTKGGILQLEYLDKTLEDIKKLCKKDIEFKHGESPTDKVKRIIAQMVARGETLNTKVIQDLAKAEGVTGYFFKHKVRTEVYEALGYMPEPIKGVQGKEVGFRLVKSGTKTDPTAPDAPPF